MAMVVATSEAAEVSDLMYDVQRPAEMCADLVKQDPGRARQKS